MTAKIYLNKEEFEYLIGDGYTNQNLSNHFNISLSVVKRIKRELNLLQEKPWNEELNSQLKNLIDSNNSAAEIAEIMNKTKSAIKNHALTLGLGFHSRDDYWTSEEITILKEFAKDRKSVQDAAICLNRTYMAVSAKASKLNIAFISKTKTHKQFCSEIKDTIKVISTYTVASNNIEVKCTICAHEWAPIAHSLYQGYGCPVCARYNHGGAYQCMTREQADVLGYPLYLYHVKLQFEDEIFYKYGLTKNANRSRYRQYNQYKVIKEISFEKYDAWTAICKEKELKSNYVPNHHFNGWTECYKE